jgi:2-oxoglutarate dehydrogenase complex dehydrogenase (E1) component-like enzyme
MNCGAYSHVNPRIKRILNNLNFEDKKLECISRRSVAAIAVGYGKRH